MFKQWPRCLYGHLETLHTAATIMFLLLLPDLVIFTVGLAEKKVEDDDYGEWSFEATCNQRMSKSFMKVLLSHQDTFYFIQTSPLPCGTHLSIHCLALASSSSNSPPSLSLTERLTLPTTMTSFQKVLPICPKTYFIHHMSRIPEIQSRC